MDEQPRRTDDERAYYDLSRRVYAVFAPFYDVVTAPFVRLRSDVAEALRTVPGMRVLDVATGTGAQALAFAETGCDVVGLDLSEAMLRVARRKRARPNIAYVQGDAASLPFEDERFDVSCVSFALHEMPRTVRERVVREMVRVTRPGGTVAIVDYALPRNAVARWVVFHGVKLYEGDLYAEFMRSDRAQLLGDAGVEMDGVRVALGGVASIHVGHRRVVPASVSAAAP